MLSYTTTEQVLFTMYAENFFSNISQTPLLVASNILIIALLYLLLKRSLKKPYRVPKINLRISCFLAFTFCLFSFWGLDWFGYFITFENCKHGYNTNLEDFYVFIINELCGNYLYFRAIVWGGALLLLYYTIRRLSISTHTFTFFFSCFFLIYFSYARVSLAMALMFYGMSLFYCPYKKMHFLSYIIAILALFFSLFLHKSAFIVVAIITISLIAMKISSRYGLIFTVIMFPLIVYLSQDSITSIMTMDINTENQIISSLDVAQNYLRQDQYAHGIGGQISTLLESAIYILIAYLCFKFHLSKNYNHTPHEIQIFTKVAFFIVLCCITLLFNISYNMDVLYIRIMRFTIIPAAIILTYFHQTGYERITIKAVIMLAWINVSYSLFYTLYNVLLI